MTPLYFYLIGSICFVVGTIISIHDKANKTQNTLDVNTHWEDGKIVRIYIRNTDQ